MQTVRGLVRASHPEPAAAVTAVSAALAASVGRGVAGTLATAAAVLAGQLSVGWMNDYLDRERDVRSGRADKPVAVGVLDPLVVRTATLAAAVAVVPLSLLSGLFAGCLHLLAVVSAWTYNLRLKATVLSVLPYVASFGLLPAFIIAGLPGRPVVGWLVAAGSLLGAGGHFANVLPDIEDDLRTGVRGLPHRIGPAASRVTAAVLLVAASVVLAIGPPGPPGAVGLGAVAVAIGCGCGAAFLGRRPGSRAPFLGVLVVAAVDVALLLASGTSVR
ncbi:MAG TPA: UbiA family prenyltransferase [Mycobacteriales bacterium]|nr:UbiA family prenyltransferase [Mycobacteriales bacterium]